MPKGKVTRTPIKRSTETEPATLMSEHDSDNLPTSDVDSSKTESPSLSTVFDAIAALASKLNALEGAFGSTKEELVATKSKLEAVLLENQHLKDTLLPAVSDDAVNTCPKSYPPTVSQPSSSQQQIPQTLTSQRPYSQAYLSQPPYLQPLYSQASMSQQPYSQPSQPPSLQPLLPEPQPPVFQPLLPHPPSSQPPISQPASSQSPYLQPLLPHPSLSQPPILQPSSPQPPYLQQLLPQPPVFQPSSLSQPPFSKPSLSLPSTSQPVFSQPSYLNSSLPQPLSTSSFASRKLLDLPTFDGSPQQWPMFMSAFNESSAMCNYTDVENLFRLQKCLKGAAREAVESLLIYPNNIERIVETLKFTFGRPELLIRHQIQKVREVPPIVENKMEQIIPLHIKVQNLVAFLTSADSQQHLNNPILLEEIVNKMPPSRQLEWAKTAFFIKPHATLADFNAWLEQTAKFVAMTSAGQTNPIRSESKSKRCVFYANTQPTETSRQCEVCGSTHLLSCCEQFRSASVSERWEIVKQHRCCFSCLKPGHSSAQCRTKRTCGENGCRKRHHQLLHEITHTPLAQPPRQVANSAQAPSLPSNVCLQNQSEGRNLLYKIVPVIAYGTKGKKETFAFLDDGSSVTMIDQELADEIGATGEDNLLSLQWYGNKTTQEPSQRVEMKIRGKRQNSTIFTMKNVRTIRNLNLPTQTVSLKQLSSKFRHIKNLPFCEYENAKPQILIGLEHCHLGIAERSIYVNESTPIVTRTKLGWVVHGPVSDFSECELARFCLVDDLQQHPYLDIHKVIKEYFSTEGFGTRPLRQLPENKELLRAKQIMKITTRRIGDRFETGLIWKANEIKLPDSYKMAYNRLLCVERKMFKRNDYAQQYNDIIKSYLQKGYARELSDSEILTVGARTWYLPHFLVMNINKPGKFRLVFDAAATANGTSLNDNLLKGPDEYTNLTDILIKFRQGRFGVCADIVEMFHQVRIRQDDQDAQRFLWRYGNTSTRPRVFVMNSMIFGASCSPASAQFVKNTNAEQFSQLNSRAVEAIVNRHYVDDYVDSFDIEEEAVEISKSVRDIHARAGFALKKFTSNSTKVLTELSDVVENDTLNMDKASEVATSKILGMHWDPNTDVFIFKISTNKIDPKIISKQRNVTKRELLRITMSIFDPYGFLANFLMYPKRLMQEVWERNFGWDDDLPQDIQTKFHQWMQQFSVLVTLQVPRCYSPNIPLTKDIQLHVFVDASEEAFAAVAYLRVKYIEVDVAFVCGKARCAPLKRLSIPRLELQAAVLGSRLRAATQQSLSIAITRTILWSDSQTVLHWLQTGSRKYRPFVAHRIGEILETTKASEWRWVPSKWNAADATTRTTYPIQYNLSGIWIQGPDFLKRDENDWPSSPMPNEFQEPIEEIRSEYVLQNSKKENSTYMYLEKYSSWWKAKRVLAWVMRFVKNLKSPNKLKAELTVQEIREAETAIFKYVQRKMFAEEICTLEQGRAIKKQSSIHKLNPGIDKLGVLRIFGILDLAPFLPESLRRPIILPYDDKFVRLIVAEYHRNFLHQNEHTIICEIRRRFHVIKLRHLVKAVSRDCNSCKIFKAAPEIPQMGQLPIDRLTPFVRPFTYTGLDYFGPIQITVARHREVRWIALFTCLTTRAVHLEIAQNLSSEACLICISNFMNRRGVPQRIRSDCGTNFVKAAKNISNHTYNNNEVQATLARKNIEWLFNCPANPSAGGCWERLVQTIKRILVYTLKNEAPKIEALHHLLTEAENMVNSRPLTDIIMDYSVANPLTPNDFLLGVASSVQTSISESEATIDLGKQYRILQQLKAKLWKKWITEYLPTLIRREKWHDKVKPIKEGDLVVICDENVPKGKWRKGLIVKVNMGKDGQVRSADVKTANGILTRPAAKIGVLDVRKNDW